MSGDFDWKNDSYKNVLIVNTSSKPNGFWVADQLERLVDKSDIDALVDSKNLLDNSGVRMAHHGVATALLTRTHSDFIDLMVALENAVQAERLDAIEHYRTQGTSQDRMVSAMRKRHSTSEADFQSSELRVQFDRDQKSASMVREANADFEMRVVRWEAQRNDVSDTSAFNTHEFKYEDEHWVADREPVGFEPRKPTQNAINPDEPLERSRELVFGQSEDTRALRRQNAIRAALERAAEDVDRARDIEQDADASHQQQRRVGYSAEYLEKFARDAEQARAERGWSRDRDGRDRDDGFDFER